MGMNRDERGQGMRVRERRSPPPTYTHTWNPCSSATHVEVTWVAGPEPGIARSCALRSVSGRPWPAPSPGPPSRAARQPQRPLGDPAATSPNVA